MKKYSIYFIIFILFIIGIIIFIACYFIKADGLSINHIINTMPNHKKDFLYYYFSIYNSNYPNSLAIEFYFSVVGLGIIIASIISLIIVLIFRGFAFLLRE